MIPANLLQAVGEEIKIAVKDYMLNTEAEGEKPVSVYLQSIPDEEWLSDSYYPLVVPRVKAVTDNGDGKSEVEIEITVGVHGEGADTWRDLLSVMERIRQRFCNNKIIGNKYHLQFPIKWETADPQPYPYWIGYGDLNYSLLTLMAFEEGDSHFKENSLLP